MPARNTTQKMPPKTMWQIILDYHKMAPKAGVSVTRQNLEKVWREKPIHSAKSKTDWLSAPHIIGPDGRIDLKLAKG